MGWVTVMASHLKQNWTDDRFTVDRLKEVYDMWENKNDGKTHVLKISLVGSVVYGAIQVVATGEVVGLVVLTSTKGEEFSYKDMDETCGPNYWDCPLSILKLLTPTTNENAMDWRKRCYVQAKMKQKKAKLSAMPVGTVIEFMNEYDLGTANGSYSSKKGDIVRLEKRPISFNKKGWFVRTEDGSCIHWKVRLISANYRVIS